MRRRGARSGAFTHFARPRTGPESSGPGTGGGGRDLAFLLDLLLRQRSAAAAAHVVSARCTDAERSLNRTANPRLHCVVRVLAPSCPKQAHEPWFYPPFFKRLDRLMRASVSGSIGPG
jgi:hypothetical protein